LLEDGEYNNAIIKHEVKNFKHTVEEMGEVLPREKAQLIVASKELEATLTIA
jgi:hypothetical protein